MSTTATTAPAKAALPNEGRPGYKHTKLGLIPEEWEVKPLGKVVRPDRKVRYGIVQAGEHLPDGIPCLRVLDLATDYVDLNSLYRTSQKISDQYKDCILQVGDIVFALRGEIGKLLLVDDRIAGINITRGVARISPRAPVQPEYLFYQLQAHGVTRRIDLEINGTSLKEVPIGGLNRVEVAYPKNLPEQRHIATLLGAWDRAIATAQQLLAAQQERKRGLIGTALGEVYHHRRKVSIGDIAREISERNADGTDPIVLSCSKHRGFVSSLEYFNKQVFSEDRSNYKVIRRGQFGFPANHIEEGSIDLLRDYDIGLVSPIYVVFEFDHTKVNSEFMYYLFKSDRYRHIFRTSTNASVDRRGSLRWNDFKNLWVPLPERDEQDRLARLLTGLDSQIEQTQNYLDHLTTQKRGLMQQLLTGAVRVKC